MPPHLGQHITWPEAVYIAHSSMTVTPQFHHLSTSVCPHWDGSSWAGIMSHSFISITPMQIRWTLLLRLRQMRWEAEPSRPTCVHPRHSPSHLLRSSGLGDSHLWAADMMEAELALLRQAVPREALTSLLSPGSGEALKALLQVHISPG